MKLLWAKVEAINPFIDPYDCHKIPVRGTWDQPWCLLWSYSVKESLVDCRLVRELRKSDCRRRLSFYFFCWYDSHNCSFFWNFRCIEMNLDDLQLDNVWVWSCHCCQEEARIAGVAQKVREAWESRLNTDRLGAMLCLSAVCISYLTLTVLSCIVKR